MRNDAEGLADALARAVSSPIGRFIRQFPRSDEIELIVAPWMTLDSVRDRHRHLVEHDWRSAAAEQFSTNNKDVAVSRPSKFAARLLADIEFQLLFLM